MSGHNEKSDTPPKETATPVTAFLAGASLPSLEAITDLLHAHKFIAFDPDAPGMFVFFALFFFVTFFVFVIGLGNLPLRNQNKLVSFFPADRTAWNFVTRIWKRMFIWFIGVVTGSVFMKLIALLLRAY